LSLGQLVENPQQVDAAETIPPAVRRRVADFQSFGRQLRLFSDDAGREVEESDAEIFILVFFFTEIIISRRHLVLRLALLTSRGERSYEDKSTPYGAGVFFAKPPMDNLKAGVP
jgi:hypothetical protein